MNFIEAAIFILFIAVISVPLATRLRLPLEVFLFIGSCFISLIPGLPSMNINPMVVFDLFLPPILFSAAYFTSWKDFKFNIRPITQLALGLVVFTAVVVAVTAKYLLPSFTWAEAFLLGAIVSPTDASAATAIVKKFGVSRRFIVLLEGESLVNDATALILYRFSLAAVIFGVFSFSDAVTQFFVLTIGGAATGLLLSYITELILQRLQNVQAETVFTFIIAFTSYLIAEHLGFSGVISTVVTGIYFSFRFPAFAQSQTKMSAKASWGTLMFVINGFVFTLIGFQLPLILKNLESHSIIHLITYGAIISIAIIATRLLWIYPTAYLPRALIPSIGRRDPMPSWQFLFAFGWTGMRGIISLAAVIAIPRTLPSGLPFPNLESLTFITYCVIVTTLIVPALTLPHVIHRFHLTETNNKWREEALARIRAMEGVLHHIELRKQNENIPNQIYNEFHNQLERKLRVIRTQLDESPYSVLSEEYLALKKLTLAAIEAEKLTLLNLRKKGEIHDEVFHALLDELAIEETRAKSLRV